MTDFEERERERERERLRALEKKDLEVEKRRGPRPLEGFSGAHTTWTGDQDDGAAAQVHGDDAHQSLEASEEQARGHYPPEPERADPTDDG